MTRLIVGIYIFTVTLLLLAQDVDERPIMKESPAKLVSVIESMASENVAAARVNVAHDAAQNRVRVFSIVPGGKTGEFKEYKYNIELIYNAKVASSKVGVVSYHFQHNDQVLAFAAAQFASGKKAFGRWLVGILAEAEPDMFWSSPTHPVMTIQQILAGLEKDDETVRDFLRDESEVWAETVRIYGPSLHHGPRARADKDQSSERRRPLEVPVKTQKFRPDRSIGLLASARA